MPFVFNMPPLTALSRDQNNAILKPVKAGEIVVMSGCPGSGKTTVVVHRVIKNKDTNFLYLAYGKLLVRYLKNMVVNKDVNVDKLKTIHSWYWGQSKQFLTDDEGRPNTNLKSYLSKAKRNVNISELFMDEAQDLHIDIITEFAELAPKAFICADQAQDVFGRNADAINLVDLITKKFTAANKVVYNIHLATNYRNTKSNYEFAAACAPNINVANIESFARSTGEKPELYRNGDIQVMNRLLLQKIKENPTYTIGVICSSVAKVKDVGKIMTENKINFTMFHNKVNDSEEIKEIIVTTYHSCKGLEFDLVIMPFVETFQTETEAQIKQLYVGMTRAKEKLFLLTSVDTLPLFLQAVNPELYILK
jgi:DNA helicase IV